MLVSLSEILKIAQQRKIAVGAFNVVNWESAKGIILAAEALNEPVILQFAPVHGTYISITDAIAIMLHFAHTSTIPVCVHLDHGDSFEICIQAIRLGFTSVMIDVSALSYDENIAITSQVVKAAHAVNVSVEAELGHILGEEGDEQEHESPTDMKKNTDNIYTDPLIAKDFVKKTQVDALAIAFGTAHGIYTHKPVLELDRITKIQNEIDTPLVMHGGSGLTELEFKTAIKNGIRKINYYTYMSLAAGKAVHNMLSEQNNNANIFFHDIAVCGVNAIAEDIKKAIITFTTRL